jgi:gag-polypeptide of LTR copia-type
VPTSANSLQRGIARLRAERQTYGTTTPDQRWVKDGIKASGLLDATIPDKVFHKINDTANVKEVWDKLKDEFEGKSRSVLVDLGRKFQTTRCGEDDGRRTCPLQQTRSKVNLHACEQNDRYTRPHYYFSRRQCRRRSHLSLARDDDLVRMRLKNINCVRLDSPNLFLANC